MRGEERRGGVEKEARKEGGKNEREHIKKKKQNQHIQPKNKQNREENENRLMTRAPFPSKHQTALTTATLNEKNKGD